MASGADQIVEIENRLWEKNGGYRNIALSGSEDAWIEALLDPSMKGKELHLFDNAPGSGYALPGYKS